MSSRSRPVIFSRLWMTLQYVSTWFTNPALKRLSSDASWVLPLGNCQTNLTSVGTGMVEVINGVSFD